MSEKRKYLAVFDCDVCDQNVAVLWVEWRGAHGVVERENIVSADMSGCTCDRPRDTLVQLARESEKAELIR